MPVRIEPVGFRLFVNIDIVTRGKEVMAQSQEKLPTDLSWQLTTTTIWCPQMKLRVALIVKDDWTS